MATTVRPLNLVVGVLLASSVGLDVIDRACAQQADPAMKAIADAWSKRQAALKTIKIVWRSERTDADLKQHLRAVSRAKGYEPPPESGGTSKVTYDTVWALCLDGDSVAIMMDIYDPRADALQLPAAGIATHTKDIFKRGEWHHVNPARPGRPHGNAWFKPAKDFQDSDLPDIRPLVLALRPLTAALMGVDLARYRVADKRPTLHGVSCLLLEPIKDEGPNRAKMSFWVDPTRDYLVLREVRSFGGQDFRTTDIDYEQNAARAWIPRRWDVVMLNPNDGKFHFAIHAHRLKAIIGEPIAPSEFELGELPAGTLVTDSRNRRVIKSEVGKESSE